MDLSIPYTAQLAWLAAATALLLLLLAASLRCSAAALVAAHGRLWAGGVSIAASVDVDSRPVSAPRAAAAGSGGDGEAAAADEEEKEEYDLFDGEWVWAGVGGGYPLYHSSDCPFLDVGFHCAENGRPDASYTKWRWQPSRCHLPRDLLVFLSNSLQILQGNYNLDAYFSALNELTFFNCLPQLVQMDLANQISFMEGAGHSVVSAFVEIVFDNSDNCIPEQMVAEKERELEEGEAQKSPSKIVADSLSQISRSSTFLPNIGVPTTSKTGRSTSLAAQAHMQVQFEEKLQAEREEAARKQEELQAQLQAQQAALEENQSLLRQTQEEVKGMHTKFEETNALLRAVLKL
ncbi:hypothetical protein ZEAMMB73_Zm00001d008391 [Zea mays]|uniref:Trichome birefringence-like N-terminal domain-containing protein n=1 Tax=Zea mays TaxID=4577 RepID=A0A1D6FCH1_MAIZE|nr:hypothetical protein ZEAMMB73_Zm00001d008391 [Zea mays]